MEELIVEGEADYNRLMRETYFEEYYGLVERFTFKSVVLPLTLEEIKGRLYCMFGNTVCEVSIIF